MLDSSTTPLSRLAHLLSWFLFLALQLVLLCVLPPEILQDKTQQDVGRRGDREATYLHPWLPPHKAACVPRPGSALEVTAGKELLPHLARLRVVTMLTW